jgi:AraC family transcriptional regulator
MQSITTEEFSAIEKVVGPITRDDLRYVDSFVSRQLCVFMPVGGNCGYAVTPDHSHPGYMFVINYDDHTRVVIGTKSHTSEPGNLFCLSPGIAHHEVQHYLPPRYSAIFVERAFFEQVYAHYNPVPPCFGGENVPLDAETKELMQRFSGEYAANGGSHTGMLDALAAALTHQIVRNITGGCEPTPQHLATKNRLNSVIEQIHLRYPYPVTVDELAETAGLSPSHFRRLFKEEVGMSPGRYLLQVRLEQAKRLLAAGEHTVTETAIATGFNSASYLSRCFKSEYAETPAAYLQRFK